MPTTAGSKRRFRACVFCTIVAFAAGSTLAVVRAGEPRSTPRAANPSDSGILTLDAEGYRYVYQAATGDEALYDLRADPHLLHDVISTHAPLATKMRAALELREHVESLDELRARHADTVRTLRSLGYL